MPQLGESMAEATIVAIKVQPGEKVAADQEIIEVETDKAVMGVTTPCPGEIAKIDAEVKEVYAVGAVLGYVEASEADAARFVKQAPEPPKDEMAKEVPGREEESAKARGTEAARISKSMKRVCRRSQPVRISKSIKAGVLPVPAGAKGAGYLSPRVKARMAELQLTQADLAAIQGSGNAGRVTIKDLETFLGGLEKQTSEDASAIRTGVADAMRRSWTRPLATVGVSVCLDPVLEDRKERDPKPGPLFMFCARSRSLWRKRRPRPRGSSAVALCAPSRSISASRWKRRTESWSRSFATRTRLRWRPNESLHRAGRSRPPTPGTSEMTSGGIASVSNFGTFGLDWGTPIPLPDQTLLLGLGAGKKAPAGARRSSSSFRRRKPN